jgi:hypothetical protein
LPDERCWNERSVAVAVMEVGEVGVPVHDRRMFVEMGVAHRG